MSINVGLEQHQRIMGADGSILWSGGQVVGQSYICYNNDKTTVSTFDVGAAFTMGEGALWQPLGPTAGAGHRQFEISMIPRQETTLAAATASPDLPQSLRLGIRRIAAAADAGFLGVTQEPIGVGKQGLVAGPGSLTAVQVTGTAPVVGDCVGGTATAGKCGVVAKGTAGLTLGICLKVPGAAPGIGLAGWAGILVAPA